MKLIDTSLLIYATNRTYPQHAAAKRFLEAAFSADEIVALPWSVILGFIRITTNRRAARNPADQKAAYSAADGWLERPNVVTLDPGPEHWRLVRELLEQAGAAGNLTNDAHLAAMAIENGAELCSADSDFARFPRLKWTDPTRG